MTVSRRKEFRARRAKRKQQERRNFIISMVVIAVGLVALIAASTLFKKNEPVGDFIQITPVAYPQEDGTAMGDANAPVRIDVFEDFQCSACRIFSEQVEPLVVENYVTTGKVYYVFRQYPFLDDRSDLKESDQTANASMCAAEQNRFWDYKAMLFANQVGESGNNYSDQRLIAFAGALGLEERKFTDCFKANRYKSDIQDSQRTGLQMGVTGTPSVFVDGQIVNPGYVPTFDDIQAAVEAALSK